MIEAVLMARDAEFFALLDARMDGVSGREARLLALLDGFADWFGRSDFYGCNFINASAEFSDPRHPVRKLVVAHKRALLNWVRRPSNAPRCRPPDYVCYWKGPW